MKTLIAWLFLICMAKNADAQNPDYPLRISVYEPHYIQGRAKARSTIRLYYAELGSFTPKTAEPFKIIETNDQGIWVYSPTLEGLPPFPAPVVVSMTLQGTTNQIFENQVIGLDEVMYFDARPCAETQTVAMFPSVAEQLTYTNERGTIVIHDQVARDLPGGSYRFEYQNRAGRVYRSVSLEVETMPHAVPDEFTLRCDETFRDYTGNYTGSGATFLWENQADGRPVSTNQNARLYPGKYNFYVTNRAGCRSAPAIVTVTAHQVLATVDPVDKQVINADCNAANGSISKMIVSPQDDPSVRYRWTDTRGNIYDGVDIYNLAPDTYTLEAYSTSVNCPTILTTVEIVENNGIKLHENQLAKRPANCGLNNGAILGLTATNVTSVNWYSSSDQYHTTSLSSTMDLKDVAPGLYTLVLENQFDCRREKEFEVSAGSPAIELLNPPIITNDNCNLGQGSITAARFNVPVSYTWLDASGKTAGTGADLLNATAGNYTLLVKSEGCEKSFPYTVGNDLFFIAPPVMDDILICAASTVKINFKENASIYRIYDAGGNLSLESKSKNITLRVDQPGDYYAALANGTCESARVKFSISFGSAGLEIPSAFSPNGDGVNDKWIIKGMDVYLRPEVKLFNRQGQLVFHSTGQPQPFDGKHNGADLPAGVYYFLVKVNDECPPRSGSIILIR